jgi:alginate O-acetyltransferase complex protein AlgI
MSFVSFEFAFLFLVTVPLFYLLPHKRRWLLVLVASYAFYMSWKASYIILIVLTTVCDYNIAKAIHASTSPTRRKLFLSLSLFLNFGLLFTFKYYNFMAGSFVDIARAMGMEMAAPTFHLLLPVGISFYTFQEVAYVIDVYRGFPPEKRFGIFATFIAFFPQLVAGPIERARHMLPQFHRETRFVPAQVVDGFRFMLWGAFKKVVIADRLAVYVNEVYGHPGDFSGGVILLATLFFAFQIYCDFSGYSDIAIGVAKTMGFDLMLNFRQPYFATSIREFWQRWHISLSTWFKDYLYFPLGGNRLGRWRWRMNITVVFLVSGIWHGANWTFVIWGALHGFYLVVENALGGRFMDKPAGSESRILSGIRILFTFSLVTLAWVFFRAQNLSQAWTILSSMTHPRFDRNELGMVFGSKEELLICFGLVGVLLIVDRWIAKGGWEASFARLGTPVRWGLYYALACAVFLLGHWGSQEFIYFRF